MRGFVVAGTSSGVGKTAVTASLLGTTGSSYVHLHLSSTPSLAPRMVATARQHTGKVGHA